MRSPRPGRRCCVGRGGSLPVGRRPQRRFPVTTAYCLLTMHCRLLPHEVRSGPANMALDEALLDAVDAEPSSAVLRTYGWSEPTLSLGYFQAIAEAEADPRWRDVPIVRRPSGGGALWHD